MAGPLYYPILIVLGITPSIVWLLYYLRKDCHPEPKHLIAKTFLMGIIVSPLAIIFQLLFTEIAAVIAPGVSSKSSFFFMWAAFVEEAVKFYALKIIVLRDAEFDEPVDAMVYMITAGLGFAAMENILVMWQVLPDGPQAAFSVWTLRFMGATLLHALSSALLGYFVALSWFFHAHRQKFVLTGLIFATAFHFVFNTFLSSIDNQLVSLAYATSLLIMMAFLISVLFDKIKERHEGAAPILV